LLDAAGDLDGAASCLRALLGRGGTTLTAESIALLKEHLELLERT
jgi:hypothetical protein